MKLSFLRFVYNGILTGMPIITYNPITQNTLNVPLTVKPYSTYINFKLDDRQTQYLDDYIGKYTDDLEVVPIPIFAKDKSSNYLSVNIYNCTSPVFMNDEKVTTRCEINTYVRNKKDGTLGTLIIDYLSNGLSMDPINIFKNPNKVNFKKEQQKNLIDCSSTKEKIHLFANISTLCNLTRSLSDELIKYTDNIYYKNGIMDKVYYDSSLVQANMRLLSSNALNLKFSYKDLCFIQADSIFYFTNQINFIGGMWDNL